MKSLTFNELSLLFLEDYKYQVKPSTYIKISRQFKNHFNPHFGHYELSNITPYELQQYVYYLNTNFVNYKKVYYNLRLAFKFALRNNFISTNPCDNLILPKGLKLPPKRKMYLDSNEMNKLLKAAQSDERPFIYPFFRLLLATGLRRQEILALTWSDVQFTDSYIDINKAISINLDLSMIISSTKNKSSTRIVSLDKKTLDCLAEWKKQQAEYLDYYGSQINENNQKQLVFSSKTNSLISISLPYKWLKELCIKAGIDVISPHVLRHTHSSTLIELSQGNFEAIRIRLGHADMSTMLRYYTHAITKDTKLANTFASVID